VVPLRLASLGGILLALLSTYPGILVDLVLIGILFSPLWCPALAVGGLLYGLIHRRPAKEKTIAPGVLGDGEGDGEVGGYDPSLRRHRVGRSLATLILCLALIVAHIPTRVGFLLSRPAFQPHVVKAPVSGGRGEPLGRLLGVYYVDRYAADPRGGVYFRTHAGADGIGPDTMSYGFAYRPNAAGTPFGRARYKRFRIVGGWYGFSASNDYY